MRDPGVLVSTFVDVSPGPYEFIITDSSGDGIAQGSSKFGNTVRIEISKSALIVGPCPSFLCHPHQLGGMRL